MAHMMARHRGLDPVSHASNGRAAPRGNSHAENNVTNK